MAVGERSIQLVARWALWACAHALMAVAVFTLGRWTPLRENVELFALPIGLGAVQAILLRRSLRWWSIAWIPASLLGLFLSFAGIWWYLLCIGLGMGTTQSLVLAAAGTRRSWVWPLASGVGWMVGMLASQPIVKQLEHHFDQLSLEIVATFVATTFIYGLFLGVTCGLIGFKHATDGVVRK